MVVVLSLQELLRLTLLDWDLPVLSTHVFVVVVGTAHDLLLASLLASGGLLNRPIEVTILSLMLRQFSRRKEPPVTGHNVVICAVLGFKAAEKDVVLLKLMALEQLQVRALEAALWALGHLVAWHVLRHGHCHSTSEVVVVVVIGVAANIHVAVALDVHIDEVDFWINSVKG